jgi:predicted methyltransferase
MGNGGDTVFLAQLVGKQGHVYAIDIQPAAMEKTKERLEAEQLLERVSFSLDGHQHLAEFVREPVQAVMFNLGWLPGGDHTVTTRTASTRQAVLAALELLKPGGIVTICAYPGHPEGEKELEMLIQLLSSLSNRAYNVLRQTFLNAGPGAPECFVIQKLRSYSQKPST